VGNTQGCRWPFREFDVNCVKRKKEEEGKTRTKKEKPRGDTPGHRPKAADHNNNGGENRGTWSGGYGVDAGGGDICFKPAGA